MPGLRKSADFTYESFFDSEKSGALLLIVATICALIAANSALGHEYARWWQLRFAGLSIEHWINDGLMAVFFLLIGLELERELYTGELSDFRAALLPIFAAAGGVCMPVLIHLALNFAAPTRAGIGIPMATDIAFALGVLALLGDRVPPSLKIFLTALAVIDDLAAIVLIALFYTAQVSLGYLLAALAVFGLLVVLNRPLRVMSLWPYLAGGVLMWFLMLRSGVHATLAGVLLAFAIPFSHRHPKAASPSHRLEAVLHRPVAFVVLPLFALANTGIVLGAEALQSLASANSLGIVLGLLLGKPAGIALAAFLAVSIGVCRLPEELSWKLVFGAGIVGGVGFTMSIFIANLAFAGDASLISDSKMAVFIASFAAAVIGLAWLHWACPAPQRA